MSWKFREESIEIAQNILSLDDPDFPKGELNRILSAHGSNHELEKEVSCSQLITVKEASLRLSCTTRFIYKLIDRGDLHRVKLGRCCRLLESDVERLIQRRLEGKGGGSN